MSIKSKLKTVGRIALKVAPYAAMAIPGVGIPLGMAIAGASSAADKKLSGGTWKQALLSGGMSAGMAGVGGSALKGIGPSSGVLKKIGAGAIGKTAGTGATGKLGAVLGSMGMNAAMSKAGGAGGGGNSGSPKSASPLASATAGARTAPSSGVMPRGGYSFDENPLNQVNQSSPNLAQSIFQGRQEAIRNQPFRRGYDVTTNVGDPNDEGIYENKIISRMPRIQSDRGGRGGGYRASAR